MSILFGTPYFNCILQSCVESGQEYDFKHANGHLYVFVHSTHLLFVFKMTAFTDQFISLSKSKANFFLLIKINVHVAMLV